MDKPVSGVGASHCLSLRFEKQQTHVSIKICTGKISNLKTALHELENVLDAWLRADQQDNIDKVKIVMKSMMGDIDEEFRSSLPYFH